jgi:ribosomal protein L24E
VLTTIASATIAMVSSVSARATESATPDVYANGSAAFYGSAGALSLAQPVVGIAATHSGHGYWLVATDGGIFSYGDAHFHGSTGAIHLNQPIVGMAATPTGAGYWLVASDGGIFAFGDARFYGSTGALKLNQPIVGMATTPSGHGYWMVASDGGIFSFGDARFYGSTGALRLNQPIVGMAATPTGHGYWFVANDGGIFDYGDAGFYGSLGAGGLAKPVAGMAASSSGHGYWLVATDGTAAHFGDAPALARPSGVPVAEPAEVVGVSRSPGATGYWIATSATAAYTAKINAAVAWFEARVGQHVYTGQCEYSVELAYGLTSAYPTAYDNWLARPDKHADWWNAPRGALVFYKTSAAGHVALSLGNGLIASTSVDNSHVGIVPADYFQNPLGWAVSPWL